MWISPASTGISEPTASASVIATTTAASPVEAFLDHAHASPSGYAANPQSPLTDSLPLPRGLMGARRMRWAVRVEAELPATPGFGQLATTCAQCPAGGDEGGVLALLPHRFADAPLPSRPRSTSHRRSPLAGGLVAVRRTAIAAAMLGAGVLTWVRIGVSEIPLLAGVRAAGRSGRRWRGRRRRRGRRSWRRSSCAWP